MKSSNIGGQAVLEGIMIRIRIVMLWLSENRTERSLFRQRRFTVLPAIGKN